MASEQKLNIYPSNKNYFKNQVKALGEADISKRNFELINSFHNYLFAKGCQQYRVGKLLFQLRTVCLWLKKELNISQDLDALTKKDLELLVSFVNRLDDKSEATKADYRRAIKQFYAWFMEDDPRINHKKENVRVEAKKVYSYLKNEVKRTYAHTQANPNTILTDTDIQRVLEKGALTQRDKAFISCLAEWGCRSAEFLNLKVGDISIKDNCAEVHLPDGKTGKRIVYSVKSLPHLIQYLEVHQFKDDKNSYLWLSGNLPLIHRGAKKLIHRCFLRAGVTKRHNLHWFRHSVATKLAPQLSESMLRKYMGWTADSEMVKVYVHLCAKDLQNVYLAMNGITTKEESTDKPIKCICGTFNSTNERYCYKCCKPLKIETAIQDKELVNTEINKTIQFFMEMAKNPELMKKFEEFKKNV